MMVYEIPKPSEGFTMVHHGSPLFGKTIILGRNYMKYSELQGKSGTLDREQESS